MRWLRMAWVTLEHGGAVLINLARCEAGISCKSGVNVSKRRIRRPGGVWVCTSTKAIPFFWMRAPRPTRLAALLRGKRNISVLTHSLLVANTTATMRNIKLIMCPGEFREELHGFLGPLTDDFIQHFQIDTLFLSLEGIDLTDGLSVVDVQDGHTKGAGGKS